MTQGGKIMKLTAMWQLQPGFISHVDELKVPQRHFQASKTSREEIVFREQLIHSRYIVNWKKIARRGW